MTKRFHDLLIIDVLSPLCRKVITTQTITMTYVVDTIGCHAGKVEYVYGGVFQSRVDFEYIREP